MSEPDIETVDHLVETAAGAIREAEALLITAGAGMGVDSGLPDFRGQAGFWRAYPTMARLGLSFEEMANPDWFVRDPHLAWAFYGHRLDLYRRTTPHPGFRRLREIGETKPHGWFVLTSNVDGQFQRAGFAAEQVAECHGSIHHFQCCGPCKAEIWDAGAIQVPIERESFRARDPLPRCPRCGGMARPNVLMFGDWAWLSQRTEAQVERMNGWMDEVATTSARLVVIELGAGSSVPTIRMASERAVRDLPARLIRINPREAEVPEEHLGIPLGAGEAIGRIGARLDQTGGAGSGKGDHYKTLPSGDLPSGFKHGIRSS